MKAPTIAFAACAFFTMGASASDFAGCDVVRIVATGDQNAHVQLSCIVANIPPCASASQFVAFDKSTTAGKQYLALFMSAQAMNAKVEGYVDHASCAPWQGNVVLLTYLSVTK